MSIRLFSWWLEPPGAPVAPTQIYNEQRAVQAVASATAKLTLATDNPVMIDTSQTTSRSSFQTVSISVALHMKDGSEPQIKTGVPLKQSGLWIIAFLSLDGRVRVASALAIDRNG